MMRSAFSMVLAAGIFMGSASAAPIGLPGQDSKQPIEINADSLEVLQAQQKAIFSGKVEARQGDMRLKADRMTVFYSNNNTSGNSISKIEVDGNVFLSTPQETASGTRGIYDTVKNYVVLEGNVVLTRDNNVLKGSRLDFDIASGRSKLSGGVNTQTGTGAQQGGRVRGLFIPQGD